MSHDPIRMMANVILGLDETQLQRLRTLLMDGGDPAGVTAVLPRGPSPREGGAEVPFESWPQDYWESQA